MGAGLVLLLGGVEQQLGVGGLGAAAAQPGGGLKRPHAHMQRKAAGVQHDAGQKGLGLQRGDVALAGHELQQFADQLAGAGSVRLVVEQDGVVDMPHRHAVMVDDHHPLAFFVDLLAFQQAFLVGVHDDQQRFGGDDLVGLLRLDEVVALARFIEQLDQLAGQRGAAAYRDDRGHAAHLADAQHADGRADGVQVAHAVAHDQHAVALADLVLQSVCNDAATHMAALFDAVGDAAEKFETVDGLDGGLIAAAAQRDIDALAGHVLALGQRFAAMAYADGNGQHTAGMQRADLVQDVEAVLDHAADVPLLHHRDVAAVGDPAQKPGGLADVLLQQAVDGLLLVGLLRILHVGKQLVVAVDDDDHVGRAAGGVLVQGIFIEGIVHQIDDAGAVGRGAGAGVSGKAESVGRDVLAVGPGADRQIQPRQHLADGGHDGVLAGKHLLLKVCIIPQDRMPRQEQHRDGQLGQRILHLAAAEHVAAQVLCDKRADAPPVGRHQKDRRRQHDHRRQQPLGRVQRHRHGQRGAAHHQQQDDGPGIQT